MYTFFDAHCDTASKIYENNEKLLKNNCHIDLERLGKYVSPVQVFAFWLDKKYLNSPFKNTVNMIEYFENELDENSHLIRKAISYKDIEENRKNNKITAIYAIEGGEAIENDLNNIYTFYEKGVRILTLTWNNQNYIGSGALSGKFDGLTDFGKKAVKILNETGIIIDVSHLNEAGFWDLARCTDMPFVATHSNAYDITPSMRNLKKDQIKEISKRGGVIGLNIYPPFLGEGNIKTDHILRHIDYILNTAGENSLGMGFDFDGIDLVPVGFEGIEKNIMFFEIVENNFGKDVAQKIFYKNFLNIFREICG